MAKSNSYDDIQMMTSLKKNHSDTNIRIVHCTLDFAPATNGIVPVPARVLSLCTLTSCKEQTLSCTTWPEAF